MRKRPSIASVPTFETPHHIRHFFTPRPSFTPHPSDFDGLEAAPSAPSDVNVARNVARGTECVDSLELLIINMIAEDEHVTRTEMAEVAKVSTKTIER